MTDTEDEIGALEMLKVGAVMIIAAMVATIETAWLWTKRMLKAR